MAVFYIKNSKSREYNIKIAKSIAEMYDGKFDFGAADRVFIKFKTLAKEREQPLTLSMKRCQTKLRV